MSTNTKLQGKIGQEACIVVMVLGVTPDVLTGVSNRDILDSFSVDVGMREVGFKPCSLALSILGHIMLRASRSSLNSMPISLHTGWFHASFHSLSR